MNGLVGQLAARWPQVALPRRSAMDEVFLVIGLVGQLATRWPQVDLPRRLPLDRPFHGHWPLHGHYGKIESLVAL